jgi:hypothetical protein
MTAPSGRLTGHLNNTIAVTDDQRLLLAGNRLTNDGDENGYIWDLISGNVAGAAIRNDCIIGFDADGRLHGLGRHAALGIGDGNLHTFVSWTDLGLDNIVAVATSGHTSYAVDNTGTLHGTTSATLRIDSHSGAPHGHWDAILGNVTDIRTTNGGAVALTIDRRILGCGYNAYNRFGGGVPDIHRRWDDLGISGVIDIHLSYGTTYAITDDRHLHFLGDPPGRHPEPSHWADSRWTDTGISNVTSVTTDDAGNVYVLCADSSIHKHNTELGSSWQPLNIDDDVHVRQLTHTGTLCIAGTDDGLYVHGVDVHGGLGYGTFRTSGWLRLPDDDTDHTAFATLVRDGHDPHDVLATLAALHT